MFARIGVGSIVLVVAVIASLVMIGPAQAGSPAVPAAVAVAPPANDAFAHARAITSLPFKQILDTRGATRQPHEPNPCLRHRPHRVVSLQADDERETRP